MTMENTGPQESNVPQDDDDAKRAGFILPSMNGFSPDDSKSPTDALPVLSGAPADQSPQLTLPATKGQSANPQQITAIDLQSSQPATTAVIQPRITRPLPGAPPVPISSTATAAGQQGPDRQMPGWLLILCLLAFILLVAGIFEYVYLSNAPIKKSSASGSGPIVASPTSSSGQAATGTMRFQVGDHPLVEITGNSGSVNVHDGNAGVVIVKISGAGSGPVATYSQSRNAQGHDLVVIATKPGGANVNYDVMMPRSAQIYVSINSGSIAVDGAAGATLTTQSGSIAINYVQGPVDARTVSGDVAANFDTGQVALATQNGSIHVSNVKGQLKAITHNGDVSVSVSMLNGQSVLQTNYGSIHFTGSIDPHGTYTMKTLSGDIDLALPANAAFQLAATTSSGSVQNAFGSNTAGNSPRAQLTITVGSGSININKASTPG